MRHAPKRDNEERCVEAPDDAAHRHRAADAVVAWIAVFAAFHVYWYLGGRIGHPHPLPPPPRSVLEWSIALALGAGIPVGTAAALVARRGAPVGVAHRLVGTVLWLGAVSLALRGAAGVIDDLGRTTGVLPRGLTGLTLEQVTGSAHPSAHVRWSGRATDLWFLLGGVLFARLARARTGDLTKETRPMTPVQSPGPRRIVIAGGGYVGLYTALHLQRRLRRPLRRGEVTITVVEPRSTMTYQPFLPEAAAGSVEPRHVVVSLRRVLRHCRILPAAVERIDHARRAVTVRPLVGPPDAIPYDVLVVGLGSVARTAPVPGLADEALGFKFIEEAIALRNRVLERLDIAGATADPELRRRALTFVVVGGGYAGVEALAELEDMARAALRFHPELQTSEMRWVLVEAAGRILPEVSEGLAAYAAQRLRRRGIEILLHRRLQSCTDGRLILSDGQALEADTLVWTAGVRANPALAATDLPLDGRGRIVTDATLRVVGAEGVWAAGDNAAVPDLTRPGELCPPTAQHAIRQARTLARNLARAERGRPARPFRHRSAGSVASLGLHKGVAEIYGIRLRGFPAWFLHRTYHLTRMPTLDRKLRIALDWTLALLFRRDIVSLGSLETPHRAFQAVAAAPAPDPVDVQPDPSRVEVGARCPMVPT